MATFQSWFQQRGVYLLPDDTPVVAQYCDLNDRPRWWFVALRDNGRLSTIVAAVSPNGSVWNYIFQPEHGVCVPQRSDLTVDDLRPAPVMAAARKWVARVGQSLALLWACDALGDLIGMAAVVVG